MTYPVGSFSSLVHILVLIRLQIGLLWPKIMMPFQNVPQPTLCPRDMAALASIAVRKPAGQPIQISHHYEILHPGFKALRLAGDHRFWNALKEVAFIVAVEWIVPTRLR